MTIDDQLKAANQSYLRSGSSLANLIQELEKELQRMKSKGLPQDLIEAKDDQIQSIINYHNQVDDLIAFYKLITLNLKFQLSEACNYIIKSSQDDEVVRKHLLTYLNIKTIPHTHGETNKT
jgi:hypothetical protein